MKLGSSFLILLHQLESFSNVTTAFWLHRENKMHKLGTEVHLYYYYFFFFLLGKRELERSRVNFHVKIHLLTKSDYK